MMAIWRRGKADALPHHSDQGRQYSSEQFAFKNPSPGTAPELALMADSKRFALPAFGMTVNVNSLGVPCHLPALMDLDFEMNAPPAAAAATGFATMAADSDGRDTRSQKLAPVAVSPTLNGPTDWHFHLPKTGQSAANFDPKAVDEIYLMVGYILS